MRGALGLSNSVGVDQTLTALETSDCLEVFNDLVEELSLHADAVYGQADQTFSTVANQAVYTLGVGGNWNTTRPVRINEPAYYTISGITFPLSQISQEQYDLIGYKAQPTGGTDTNQWFLYVNENPLGLVTLWPVPNAILSITFSIDRVLTQIPAAGTTLTLPPGYANMYKYVLAVRLAPLFGKEASASVQKIAGTSLGSIKRANMKPVELRYDAALTGGSNYGYGYP